MDGLGHIQCTVVLDEQSLQVVVVEGFVAKFYVLVADVGQHGSLRVQVVVEASLGNDAPLNVAE